MRSQAGFSLVMAVFVCIILAAMATFMVSMAAVQQATGSQALLQSKAYYAAQSGLEWQVYQVLKTPGTPPVKPAGCQNTQAFSLTESAQNGFAVTVTCAMTLHQVNSVQARYYLISATATRGVFGNSDFVSRTLEAKIGDIP